MKNSDVMKKHQRGDCKDGKSNIAMNERTKEISEE